MFMARTTDGAKTWKFVSWIGPEPDGFSIMSSSVRLSKTRILTTIRRKEGPAHASMLGSLPTMGPRGAFSTARAVNGRIRLGIHRVL